MNERSKQFITLANQLILKYPHIITTVRGWGLLIGIEISAESSILSSDIANELLLDGLLVVPAGPKVIRFIPPLIVNSNDIEIAINKLDYVLDKLNNSNIKK